MTAQEKFKIGDQVKPTRLGSEAYGLKPNERAKVIGFAKNPLLIRIKRNGAAWHQYGSMDAWERADNPEQ